MALRRKSFIWRRSWGGRFRKQRNFWTRTLPETLWYTMRATSTVIRRRARDGILRIGSGFHPAMYMISAFSHEASRGTFVCGRKPFVLGLAAELARVKRRIRGRRIRGRRIRGRRI